VTGWGPFLAEIDTIMSWAALIAESSTTIRAAVIGAQRRFA
jgi:hypothetical protein